MTGILEKCRSIIIICISMIGIIYVVEYVAKQVFIEWEAPIIIKIAVVVVAILMLLLIFQQTM